MRLPNRILINDTSLVFGERGAQTERVMNAVFPEEGMLHFHRVSLEMTFADNFLENRNRRTQRGREIIELDDDDDEMADGTQTNVPTGKRFFKRICSLHTRLMLNYKTYGRTHSKN